LGADLRDDNLLAAYDEARRRLVSYLETEFPRFSWRVEAAERRAFMPLGALDPVELLEIAVAEKLRRHWDFVLLIVPNELTPLHGPSSLGIPSSALESAVLSTSQLGAGDELVSRIVALALHLLGHLWGLEHAQTGPMRRVKGPQSLSTEPFPPDQRVQAEHYLREVAASRLEEERARWGVVSFYWRTLQKDARGIAESIWGYKPWLLPLYLGRLTAAAAVSVVYFLLTADGWALGGQLSWRAVCLLALLGVSAATGFLFAGQDLGKYGREWAWREQLARTRLVVMGTLTLGIVTLWLALFLLSLAGAWLLPRPLLREWMGVAPAPWAIVRYAVFTATIGVLGAALGGNLEEEREIKAELLIDEEA